MGSPRRRPRSDPRPIPGPRGARHASWFAWLAPAAALLAHFPALSHGWIFWDDHSHVFLNPRFQTSSLGSLLGFWTEPYRGFFIPVTYTTWGLVAWAFGLAPWAFHAASLALHAANTALAHRLCSLATPGWPALAGALVFAMHPLQVEAVQWVTGTKDLLASFFSLLSLLAWFSWGKARASFAFFLAAALSKPSTVTLPLVVLWLDRTGFSRVETPGRDPRPRLDPRRAWPWLAASAVIVLWTATLQPSSKVPSTPVWLRPFTALDSIGFYLTRVLWPVELSPLHGRTPTWLLESGTWRWSWVFPLAFAGVVSRARPLRAGLGFAFLALLPVSGILVFTHQLFSTVAEHYAYLAMAGVAIAVSSGSAWLASRAARSSSRTRGLAAAVAAGVLAVLAWRSWHYGETWSTDERFFARAFETAPKDPTLRSNYGVSLARRGRLDEAIAQFRIAASLEREPEHWANIGAALAQLGRTEEARAAYAEGLKIDPKATSILNNMGGLPP